MKKAVVLGSAGMAGHVMRGYLGGQAGFSVVGLARNQTPFTDALIDVSNFNALEQTLSRYEPDYVINCVGILVQQSASDLANAVLINSYLPHYLASLGNKLGFKLIHISTDCVFSGSEGGYSESSFRDGDDNYARTKALGEVVNDRDLTIRTSIIGPELKIHGTGLLDWFIKQNGEIKGYSQAFWSGVTTLELAKATQAFLRQNISGLYNLCPKTKISKFDLLRLFAQTWHKDISISPYDGYRIDKSLVCTRSDFDYTVPDYQTMLTELKAWMDGRADYYPHYDAMLTKG